MPNWFEVGFSPKFAWWSEPNYWAKKLIANYQQRDAAAYAYPVGMEAYKIRHTLLGVVLDSVMVLIDRNRGPALVVAFPAFIGSTVGAPLYVGQAGKPEAKEKAAEAERQMMKRAGLDDFALIGPDESKWKVVAQELSLSEASELFDRDGRTLTEAGALRIEKFIRDVLAAVGEWVFTSEEARSRFSDLQVEVSEASMAISSVIPSAERPANDSVIASNSRAQAQVEIYGSTQTGFITNPTLSVHWNGRLVGNLKSVGGHFAFGIEGDGELRLKWAFRSARVQVKASGITPIYLQWDRFSGKLVTSHKPI